MDIQMISHTTGSGWDGELPPLSRGAQLGFVFGGADLLADDQPMVDLAEQYPEMTLVGCSSTIDRTAATRTGAIATTKQTSGQELVAALVSFQAGHVLSRSSRISKPSDSAAVGANLARCLNGPTPSGVLVFGDATGVDERQLLSSMRSQLPDDTVVTGGLTETAIGPNVAWTLVEGRPTAGHVTAIGLYGEIDVEVAPAIGHDDPFAPSAGPVLSMAIGQALNNDARGWNLPAGSASLDVGVATDVAEATPFGSRTLITEAR